jgi:hypothetical protein
MPRSSDSVAALASALAKAQVELVNPEKSLTAIINNGRPGASGHSFRYAPLSSGPDIVRKTLGRHEITTIQSTTIDPAAGMVNLTTTLAHASGEWGMAGLPDRRNRQFPADGHRATIRAPLCAVHAGWHCWLSTLQTSMLRPQHRLRPLKTANPITVSSANRIPETGA